MFYGYIILRNQFYYIGFSMSDETVADFEMHPVL